MNNSVFLSLILLIMYNFKSYTFTYSQMLMFNYSLWQIQKK